MSGMDALGWKHRSLQWFGQSDEPDPMMIHLQAPNTFLYITQHSQRETTKDSVQKENL